MDRLRLELTSDKLNKQQYLWVFSPLEFLVMSLADEN